MAGEGQLAHEAAAAGSIHAEHLKTTAVAWQLQANSLMKVQDIPRSENRKALAPLTIEQRQGAVVSSCTHFLT